MTEGSFIQIPRGLFHYHRVGTTGPQIYFCHGNSLSAGTYLPFLNLLTDKGFQVFAGDLRGHGCSTKHRTDKIDSWEMFIRDLAMMVESITEPPVVGIGHSIGAYFMYAAAARNPHLFSKLILLDPIIFPPVMVWTAALARKLGLSGKFRLAQMTRNKKYKFASKQEALDHYRGKGMFASWQQKFVNAYVDTAIEKVNSDSYRLCCLPAFESQIYEHVPLNTWSHAPGIDVPTLVVRGETSDLFFRQAGRRLTNKISDCRFVELAGLGHFFIMENPGRCMDTVTPFLLP